LLEGIREKLKEEEQQKDIEVEELRLRRSCRIEVMLLLMKLLYDVKEHEGIEQSASIRH
jgi:hypothetical protein